MTLKDSNKTVAVKITSSCLVGGIHLQEGEAFEMDPDTALDLVAAKRAVIVRIRPSSTAPATPQLIPAA